MRNFEMNKLLVLTLGVFVTACSERPTEPGSLSSPAIGGAAACPTPADVVVSDEGSLLAALSAAEPGDVIGIDGLIAITGDFFIETEELTLTCATSGSGLVAQPGVFRMVRALAKGVRVERLILDAGASSGGPYLAVNNGATAFAEDVRLSNNIITCGPETCAFLRGVAGARIEGNRFESGGSLTGVHIQGQGPRAPDGSQLHPTDGTRVTDNTIIAAAPSSGSGFGGIRIRDGANLVVESNNVLGPWANSIAVANVLESDFDGNRLEGATRVGIVAITGFNNPPISARDNRFRNNTIVGAGLAAIFARRGACRNLFQGNELQFNPVVVFDVATGANTLKGTPNAVVTDDGNFDCDGDGEPDPNVILGVVAASSPFTGLWSGQRTTQDGVTPCCTFEWELLQVDGSVTGLLFRPHTGCANIGGCPVTGTVTGNTMSFIVQLIFAGDAFERGTATVQGNSMTGEECIGGPGICTGTYRFDLTRQ